MLVQTDNFYDHKTLSNTKFYSIRKESANCASIQANINRMKIYNTNQFKLENFVGKLSFET